MKSIQSICVSFSVGAFMISSSLVGADRSYNANLLMLRGELMSLVDQATEAHTQAASQPSEKEVNDIKDTCTRVAKIYFSEETPENKKEIDNYIGATLKQNSALKSYFVFLGNAFAEEAMTLVDLQRAKQKKTRTWGLVGGTVLGLALAGGYIYVKTSYLKETLTLKDALIGAAAIGGGVALGYGGSVVYTYMLPIDRSITNAKDFAAKYPHGEDFVRDITKDSGELAYQVNDLMMR